MLTSLYLYTESVAADAASTANRKMLSSRLYVFLEEILSTYWVLAVVGAFLLVTLPGDPSLLKTVYLIFFFVFLITYQVGYPALPPSSSSSSPSFPPPPPPTHYILY